MRINKELNLVIPFFRGDDQLFAHSTPVSRDVFERYHAVLSDAFGRSTSGEKNMISAASTAILNLKDAAIANGVWEGKAGVQNGFVGEIHRITNVVMPSDNGGWETVLMYDAVKSGRLSADEVYQIENAVVFFTFLCWLFRVGNPQKTKVGMTASVGLRTTSFSCTEFCDSLPIKTKDESTTPMAT